MPSWWCGPKLRLPKWAAPRLAEARMSFRRRLGTNRGRDSKNDGDDGVKKTPSRSQSFSGYGARLRNSLRRGRSIRMRRGASFRDSMRFRRSYTGSMRRENSVRRRKMMSDIQIIRRSYCGPRGQEPSSTISSDGQESIELNDMTKQADNLWREYEQMKFQEKWRDDMLSKLHSENLKLNPEEEALTGNFKSFCGVKSRADSLLDQIRVLIRKFLVLSQGDPALVEACFQIIEEEERRDEEAATCFRENGFESPDRPKAWKEKCLKELRKVPLLRVENTPQLDRSEDRSWLAKHMELMSQKLREDLHVVKKLFEKTVHLHKEIAQFFVDTYYEYLAQHIQDIISTGLRHNEIIQLLSWLTEHKAEMEQFNTSFVTGVCLVKAANSLLPDHTTRELEQSYTKTVHANIKQWGNDALRKESEDWYKDEPPKQDKDGFFYTEFPVHLFELLQQNLDVARVISAGTYKAFLGYCLDEVRIIVQQYAAEVKAYIPTRSVATTPPPSPTPSPKSKSSTALVKKIRKTVEPHLAQITSDEKRQQNKPKHYVQYAGAALNNFLTIIDCSHIFKQQLTPTAKKAPNSIEDKVMPKQSPEKEAVDDDDEKVDDFTYSLNTMRTVTDECVEMFLNDLYAEMKPLLKQVGSKQWFGINKTSCVGDVCDLITAYTSHVRRVLISDWPDRLEQYLRVEYSKGFSRKGVCITCKNAKDRRDAADQICLEMDQVENTLASVTRDGQTRMSGLNILCRMAEVVRLTDKSMIDLVVTSLVQKHPEVTRKQLKALLRLRGDFSSSKIKKILVNSMAQDDTDSIGYGSGESTVTIN
ncbi:exocyst complex component 3-like [Diadema setosum]|uniref:exocyst complex component 3-like n=1 Tax=Diadema setosum TaxID=31175 RepID=UPI003B3A75D3